MISTNGITMQFGAKPLFENVSVKFGEGNRYGLIGANGSGKSTFMKILGGDLEPSGGEVAIENGVRLGKLRQDQFAYEDMRVLDVVMMGHVEMWAAMTERDAIYANLDATEDDYMRAADLEAKFAEYDGYTAEARAGELLSGVGISEDLHNALMSEVAPGFKLRVLLAQALFSKPDVLLLDEPTNNLDINTIRWLEGVLNQYDSTMIIISHDRHFLNEVCTHMADVDYNSITIYPGNYDDYMLASAQSRERAVKDNAKAKERLQELQEFVARFSANKSKARQATSRLKQADKIKSEMVEVKPSTRQNPYIRFEPMKKTSCTAKPWKRPAWPNALMCLCLKTSISCSMPASAWRLSAPTARVNPRCSNCWPARSTLNTARAWPPMPATSNGRKKPMSATTRKTMKTISMWK
jgi:ATPase subunit of ABC transporter with duplicated ATPase domains